MKSLRCESDLTMKNILLVISLLLSMGKRFESGNAKWELYDLSKDISEENNLATSHPERLTELVELWEKMNGEMSEPLF
jgi:arylsulfatase A-like enzyme